MTDYKGDPAKQPRGPVKPVAKPPRPYTARDHFLAMTDQSNWGDCMKGEFRKGYEEAMTSVHEGVMDFWPELSERELPVPSGKAKRAQAMVVEWLDGFDPVPQINFQQSEALQAIIADALPSPLEESGWRTMDSAPELSRLRKALEPSAETKVAYMGEFVIRQKRSRWNTLTQTEVEVTEEVTVPWTTIKEIMKAISAFASAPPTKGGDAT